MMMKVKGEKMDITEKIDVLVESKYTWYGAGAKGRPVVRGVDFNLAKKYGFETRVKDKTGYYLTGIFPQGKKWSDIDGGVEVHMMIDDYLPFATGEIDKALVRVQVISTLNGEYKELYNKDHFIYNIKGDQGVKGLETLMKQYKNIAEREAMRIMKK
jgi:hypothetical protein